MRETTRSTPEITRRHEHDCRFLRRSNGFRFLVRARRVALYSLMVVISFVRFGFSFDWDTYPLSRYFVGFAIATAIHLVVNYFTGLYEREPRLGVRPWLPRALLATGIGVAVQGLAFVVLDRYLMPRLNLAVFLTWRRSCSSPTGS
jgi:phosphatidylserine synthase